MHTRVGPAVALTAGVVTVATVVWVAVSVSRGADLTDLATVGQFILAIVTLVTAVWATRAAFSPRADTATSRAARLSVNLGTREGCRMASVFVLGREVASAWSSGLHEAF